MNRLELKIPPVVVFLIFALVMQLVSSQIPAFNFYFSLRLPVAMILSLIGGIWAVPGIVSFIKSHTTVSPTKPESTSMLVTRGVYRLSRNPMYLGLLFVLAAWAVWLSNLFAFIFLPAFVLYMNRFQILPEERALQAKFGSGFNAYTMKVRRWL
ncbi:MAG: isoprenylcysteine carboxylmethyltransferase family protein [Syntrophus sp. (in: bacteria)]|nr:isoprenylcysteine carboxylmethyltransferase family protein [Syntrophus sp. (in: bacteria)]